MMRARRPLAAASLLLALGGDARADAWSPPIDLAPYARSADVPAAVAAAAPVQSVNGGTGAIQIPAYQRQVSAPLAVPTGDGVVTWSFPSPFKTMPSCWPSLATATSTYTFDFPVQTAIALASVSYQVSAHPKSLSIASLTLPIVLQLTPPGPPAGTTLTLSCFAPL